MKTTTSSSLILIFSFCFLLFAKKSNAQTCTASFNYTLGSSGAVNYASTSLGTNSTTTYFWDFGDGTTFSTTAISATNTFNANGNYPVSLFISNSVPSCTSLVTQAVTVSNALCVSSFTSAIGADGAVSFASTSLNTNSTTTYFWDFGNSTTYTAVGNPGIFTSATYTSNGTYSVTLFISLLTPTCSSSITQTVSVGTVTACNIVPAFSFTNNAAGSVNFQSTSTGTNASTSYTWMYGDSSPNSTGIAFSQVSHTYAVNGTYSVSLFLANTATPTCLANTAIVITVTNSSVGCSLTANFSSNSLGNGSYQFQNTSTGTVISTSYFWNFGDGITLNGSNTSPIHQYSINGNYVITLTVNNNYSPACVSTATQSILVSFPACSLTTNFSHIVGIAGAVSFSDTSVGTYSNTVYTWDFGDGIYSNTKSPMHTYINAGTYYVNLYANNFGFCSDSITYAINVTGVSCVAKSNFNLNPAGTPQNWNVTPVFPWNVTTAVWDWGDGSTSNNLYTSHTYAAAGTYSICLTVTVSCGASSSSCSSYAVYKTSGLNQDLSMIYINVTKPSLSTSLLNLDGNINSLNVYPNPNNGLFNLSIQNIDSQNAVLTIYNLVGELIQETTCQTIDGAINQEIQLQDVSDGVYFLKVNARNKLFTKKLVINR